MTQQTLYDFTKQHKVGEGIIVQIEGTKDNYQVNTITTDYKAPQQNYQVVKMNDTYIIQNNPYTIDKPKESLYKSSNESTDRLRSNIYQQPIIVIQIYRYGDY